MSRTQQLKTLLKNRNKSIKTIKMEGMEQFSPIINRLIFNRRTLMEQGNNKIK